MNQRLHLGLHKCQPAPVSVLIAALRVAMEATGASIADTAKWCGVSPPTICRWLRGERPVAFEKVMRSQRLYPHFIDYLVTFHTSKFDSQAGIAIASDC